MDRDQATKYDAGKPRLTLIPSEALYAVARTLEYGAAKYEPDGWRRVDRERYMDALARHWLAEKDDPGGRDTESGLLHTDHIAANAAIICALAAVGRNGT